MLKTWIRYSTPECRNIVRAILSSHSKGNGGVTTQEIYDLAIKQFPDAKGPPPPEKFYLPDSRGRRGKIPMPVPEPPNRYHPIRSMKYLKRVVLEDMVEREEVEKVHIRKGIVNKDGERLDVIVSKKTGIEYQPDILGDKMEMWVWRLRQPREAMDTSEVREMKQNPSPLHPREDYDSRSSRPTHPHRNTSPRSSSVQNTDKPPSWAGEYSAKRPARGHRQGGPLQPRFHMSWGAHWKGKSGAHGIHFSSSLRSPLAEDAMSSPNPIYMSQPTGYQAQKRGSIVDQLPMQHFNQTRDEKVLTAQGHLVHVEPNRIRTAAWTS